MIQPQPDAAPPRRPPVLAVLLTVLILGAGVIGLYVRLILQPRETELALERARVELQTSLRLRHLAIEEWVSEGLRDARMFAGFPSINRAMTGLMSDRDRDQLRYILSVVLETQRARYLRVFSPESRLVVWADEGGWDVLPSERRVVAQAQASGSPVAALGLVEGEETVLFAAPLSDGRGVVVLAELASDWLNAYLQTWPALGSTTEVLLLERRDDSVRYLGPLRFDTATPNTMGRALEQLLGAEALVGFGGDSSVGEYRDYRGVEVMAATAVLTPVPWSLVVKRDREEILGTVRQQVSQSAVGGGLLLMVAAALAILITLVTHQADLRTAVKERTAELERANQYLETVHLMVSHDFRGPLQVMTGNVDLLEMKHGAGLDQDAKGLLNGVRQGISGLDRMFRDLLDLGRARRAELLRTEVDMGGVVEEVLAGIPDARRPDGLVVEVGALPTVVGDRALLRQVWANLIGNALKFLASTPTPRVAISGEAHPASVRYRIRDNGPGFPAKLAERLFSPYQRGEATTRVPGHGIGLAIVQQVIERHGGRVGAESRPGEGAEFWFELPA